MAITASYDTLMRQASMTVEDYMSAAIRSIDKKFGEGYAKANPVLVAAYINGCTKDFGTSALIVAIQEATEVIAESLRNQALADSTSEMATAIEDAAREIATAIEGHK